MTTAEPRTALDYAREYLRHGWTPLPVPRGEKNPGRKGWQKFTVTEADLPLHFGNGANVGILLGSRSANLVDVDLDSDEAVALAPAFLRPTKMISGRTGRLASHWWYCTTASVPRCAKLYDPKDNKSVLLELRVNGMQTLVEPSTHPDGADVRYQWEGALEPAEIAPGELEVAVHRLGAAALLAQRWPKTPGKRHDAANALAGMLLRAGWSAEDTAHLIRSSSSVAGDEESSQRATDATATARSLASGKKVTGAKALGEIIGKDAVDSIRKWLRIAGPVLVMTSEDLPEIRITTDIRPVVDAAEGALLAQGGGIYQRGPILVRITRDGAAKLTGIVRPPGAPVITPLPDAVLLEALTASARWVKFSKRAEEWTPALPPSWVVQVLQERAAWAFAWLEGVSESPVLRPDGTVVETPGYDAATGILYDPGEVPFPKVPDTPTLADAVSALALLSEPYSDFPFTSVSDFAAALAVPLTVLARPAIPGPTPLFGHTAPTPGSGKGLMVDVSSIIATGRRAAIMSSPKDDDEARKRILALAIEGCPIVSIDNISGRFGNDTLAGALTAYTFKDRLLSFNKSAEAPMRMTWTVTGNNIVYRGDLARRVVRVRIDPRCEHPEDRTEFVHKDLCDHVIRERPKLVVAALTLLRAFMLAGCPSHGKPPMGSFEHWDRIVRGALVWAGGTLAARPLSDLPSETNEPIFDPLGNRAQLRAESDSDLDALRAALAEWTDAFKSEPRTAAETLKVCGEKPKLKAALAELADCPVDRFDSRRLGYCLRAAAGRVAEGMSFEHDKTGHAMVMQWFVHDNAACKGCKVCM